MKKEIGGFFRRMWRDKVRRKREEKERLVGKLHFLFRCKKFGLEVDKEIKEVRQVRNEMLKERGKGIVFKVKVEEKEEGESCSRFFFKKAFGPKKAFCKVLKREEEMNGDGMKEAMKTFYEDLEVVEGFQWNN